MQLCGTSADGTRNKNTKLDPVRGLPVVVLTILLVPTLAGAQAAAPDDTWLPTSRLVEPADSPVKLGLACRVPNNPACGWSQSWFGSKLAIDGATAVVAEPGAIHIYEQQSALWTRTSTFTDVACVGATFALQGATLAIGDPCTSTLVILERAGSTWSTTHSFSAEGSGCLGRSVDLQASRIIVGDNCASRVHVVERVDGAWQEAATLTIPGVTELGAYVASGGDLVYARAADEELYIFERPDQDWLHTHVPTEAMGNGFAADGDRFAVLGADAILVYERDGDDWPKVATLQPRDASPFTSHELFGWSFDLKGDTVVVGAPRDETSPQEPANGGNTRDVCLSAVVRACAPARPGAAYVFESQDHGWSQTAKLIGDPVGDQRFGEAVSIDETRILVGAPNKLIGQISNQGDSDPEDSVFVFDRVTGGV